MGCKNCNKNVPKRTSTVPSKTNLKELIERIKKERKVKDKTNG
jgi:hypothetical protein